jgi:hypothetical protein
MRRVIVENILLLIKIVPKADPIVKELVSLLDGDKIDGDQKIDVSETLALVIRNNGKTISSTVSPQVYNCLTKVIENPQGVYNDKIILNSSIALAFLSAYASDPN